MSSTLNRRQISVQRDNLAAMCRISVKSLLDYACLYTHVDDDCEEFINFCSVFEQMVSHRLRPYQKKVWLPGHGSPRHFWDVLLENHNRTRNILFPSCIPTIEAIETIKSPKAKLRAFVRVALMEKRLSDYLYWLLDNTCLIRESFLDGALLASDESTVLCGDLIGLNAIDFNFCLKGNEKDLVGPLEINYAPFLKYKQTSASRSSDEIEMLRLSGKDSDEEDIHPGSVLTESNVNDILRLQHLEKDYRSMKEQKDYLEELVRLRERQVGEMNLKIENMKVGQAKTEKERERERQTLDACVLELQAEITSVRKQNVALKEQVAALRRFQQRVEMKEIPMMDMATGEEAASVKPEIHVEMDRIDDRVSISNSSLTLSLKKEMSPIPLDKRSIMSSTSDQIRLKEDSQSMVPLTGSLADVNVAMLDSAVKEDPEEETPRDKEAESVSEVDNSELKGATKTNPQQLDPLRESDLPQSSESRAQGEQKGLERVFEEECEPKNQNNNMEETVVVEPAAVMSESYVVTEEHDLPESSQISQGEDKNSDDDVDSTVPATAGSGHLVLEETEKPNSVLVLPEGPGSNGESEKEEEIVTSDPELVNPSNTSSDGSDAAWDMLSDTDQNESREEKDQ